MKRKSVQFKRIKCMLLKKKKWKTAQYDHIDNFSFACWCFLEFSILPLFYQPLVKMNSKKLIQVAGFQFEPERSEETQGEIYRNNGYEKSESDTMGQDPRIFSDPWTWRKCGKCWKMTAEKECLCCKEVESLRYFDLHGN